MAIGPVQFIVPGVNHPELIGLISADEAKEQRLLEAAAAPNERMDRIIITIDGPNFQDREEAEVMGLPEEGEMINTKYGPCVVTGVELLPDSDKFLGKVACRMP